MATATPEDKVLGTMPFEDVDGDGWMMSVILTMVVVFKTVHARWEGPREVATAVWRDGVEKTVDNGEVGRGDSECRHRGDEGGYNDGDERRYI